MAKRGSTFTTLTTEGGLLPADLLARIAQNDGSLDGLRPTDYHLNSNERLGEMINRSWNRVLGAWTAFQESLTKLAPSDNGTTVTRERWLLVLFEELGFGRLQPAKAIEIGGRQYPISHDWGGAVPLHLVGARIDLNKATPGVAGAARKSPHSLVQEFLNASPSHLWGLVSNGFELRLLRDSASVTRQAYVALDLAAMMDGQVYPDFVLLWLLLHESRFEGEDPRSCWLEKWASEAEAAGSRALERLREGVELAISEFGRGFLANPANRPLREVLRSGALDVQDFYRELLRLVYRLIFLFAAEDRGVLLAAEASDAARMRYAKFYSTERLRRLAERRRGTSHDDLYRALRVVMVALGSAGSPPLGLPGLGSFLWGSMAMPHLETADLSNRHLLAGVASLAFHFEQSGRTRTTDYRNLGAEELGSVYEALLELHPDLNIEASTFRLETALGHERKSTGSYYTPSTLIGSLLDSTLEPLLAATAGDRDPEAAILSIKILDPACGSGHFLIAAGHRIAKRLATARSGDDEPPPPAIRGALRDVIGRCLYGVDTNEMAVELCKVSLWMEALEPGRPLSFLDHHIVHGDSLVGATPHLLAQGVPDQAFDPVEGDDRAYASSLRRQNAQERRGEGWLMFGDSSTQGDDLRRGMEAINALSDDTLGAVVEKEARYNALRMSAEARTALRAADAWCAAFVSQKTAGLAGITEGVVQRAASGQVAADAEQRRTIDGLAEVYAFHHWHLTFPDVFRPTPEPSSDPGWTGGFDLVLGNPPWGQVELKEKEWFASRRPDIAAAAGAARKKLIASLADEDPGLWAAYRGALRMADSLGHFLRTSGRYPLCGQGRINTYSVFAETMRALLSPRGRAGMVVPPGIATDDTTKDFFRALVEGREIVSLYGFENRRLLFPGVHAQQQFCLLTISAAPQPADAPSRFVFNATAVSDIDDPERAFELTPAEILLLNPNSGTCPVFKARREVQVQVDIYRRLPILIRKSSPERNPWAVELRQGLFNITSASDLFRSDEWLAGHGWERHGSVFSKGGEEYWPLWESKMFSIYDQRWKTFESGEFRAITRQEKEDPTFTALPRYWVPQTEARRRLGDWDRDWLPVIRKITNPENERTAIPSLVRTAGVGDSANILFVGKPYRSDALGLVSCMSSFAFDFCTRLKLSGRNLIGMMLEQLPVIPPETLDIPCAWDPQHSFRDWLYPRALQLAYTSVDLDALGAELGHRPGPFAWDPDRRWEIACEMDAAWFHVFGFSAHDVEYALGTFGALRDREIRTLGRFRTAESVLNSFDRMKSSARATGSAAPARLNGLI